MKYYPNFNYVALRKKSNVIISQKYIKNKERHGYIARNNIRRRHDISPTHSSHFRLRFPFLPCPLLPSSRLKSAAFVSRFFTQSPTTLRLKPAQSSGGIHLRRRRRLPNPSHPAGSAAARQCPTPNPSSSIVLLALPRPSQTVFARRWRPTPPLRQLPRRWLRSPP